MRFAGIVLEKEFVRNAVSGVAPCTIARVRGSRGALQLVDGSQPSLARRVRKAPAMVDRRPLFGGTTRLVSFPGFYGLTITEEGV